MRAKRGSVEAQQLVGMSQDLFDRATEAAKAAGISQAEWWRRAGELALAEGPAAFKRLSRKHPHRSHKQGNGKDLK